VSFALGSGRSQLVLADKRPPPHGHYTLVLRRRSGRRLITTRQSMTIG
jgi:hypothetical protein